MTTASSLTFPTMEVPAAEDSMEMASPYQGHADDFDIDIDIMEDHVSNMDSDMMGADDYPTSQPSLFQTDANNDADMVDEASEGSMVDADDYVDEDHDIEAQDEDVTYEAEMQEGDQGVSVDAPELPTIQVEVPANEGTMNEPVQSFPEAVERPRGQEGQDGPGDLAETSTADLQPEGPEGQAQRISLEPSEAEGGQPGQPRVTGNDQANADTDKVELVEGTNETAESKDLSAEHSYPHGETTVEDLNASQIESESVSHEAKDEHAGHEPHSLGQAEDRGHHHDESLHPVKVLYQENEISLFPPLEGDSAETFFLHDEDVAYDSVGKLFGSLREVLLDNVAENEVLVIDIDSLGIQITEDSSYTSKMTLHQILDIYLRLCHNDGTDEPEALYLALSSKPAVSTELAALDAAANEGKGLSQIHPWDDYDVEEPAEEEYGNTQGAVQPDEELHPEETHQDQAVPESDEGVQKQELLGDKSHDGNDAEEEQEEAVPEASAGDHEAEAAEAGSEHVVEVQHEEGEVVQEYHQPEEAQSADDDDQNEDWYDSEAHKTESSATLAEPTAANEHAENAYADEIEGAEENHGTDDQDGGSADRENFDDQEQNEANDLEEPDEFQDDFVHEESLSEENADDDRNGLEDESVHGAEAPPENASAENLAGDIDHASYEQSESTLENVAQEDVANEDRTPEPEDDLLDIDEDFMQTPAEDHPNGQHKHTESAGHGGYNEDELAAPSADQGGANDSRSAADDFDDFYPPPDLEVTEAIELGGTNASNTDSQTHDNLSTKRSREEKEEWDIADTTTPDTKRRRS